LPLKLPRGKPKNINRSAIIIDATEKPINVQKTKKKYCSGKKRKHTLKVQVIIYWRTSQSISG